MNRSIVIFVALAVLVAHSLAIRTDLGGDLAPPYDQAFVAFRIARNLIFEGEWSWSPGVSGFDSYPSTLWVLICAMAERVSLSINTVARAIGVIASGCSLVMATRFHPERAASLITPMLLAISGAMAAAAVNGTETALLTALVTAAFLAYERKQEKTLAVTMLLCGWTRGEGWLLVVLLLVLRAWDKRRGKQDPNAGGSLLPFALPAVGFGVLTAFRFQLNGYVAPPWFADLVDLREGELENGYRYVRDFFYSSASPALILYAVWYLLRRNLSRTGLRALIIFLAWTAFVVVQGGGETPFSETMVPVLPLALIAGQEGLITALNSWKAPVRALAWTSFLFAVILSTLASFRPTKAGPADLGDWQRQWMRSEADPRFGFDDQLGRMGLDEEAKATRVLRDLALYMRDQVDPRRTVLTPWPGSIAYLSSLPVIDLLGHATPVPPYERTSFEAKQKRVDILAILELEPDYILPFWRKRDACPTTAEVANWWHVELDLHPTDGSRAQVLREAFEAYEVVTVPLNRNAGGKNLSNDLDRGYLLRRRELGQAPTLIASLEENELLVQIEHRGHYQLGDLSIRGYDKAGNTWHMNPQGRFIQGKPILTRPNLLLTETGERRLELIRTSIANAPEQLIDLRIRLLNPKSADDSHAMHIASEIQIAL